MAHDDDPDGPPLPARATQQACGERAATADNDKPDHWALPAGSCQADGKLTGKPARLGEGVLAAVASEWPALRKYARRLFGGDACRGDDVATMSVEGLLARREESPPIGGVPGFLRMKARFAGLELRSKEQCDMLPGDDWLNDFQSDSRQAGSKQDGVVADELTTVAELAKRAQERGSRLESPAKALGALSTRQDGRRFTTTLKVVEPRLVHKASTSGTSGSSPRRSGARQAEGRSGCRRGAAGAARQGVVAVQYDVLAGRPWPHLICSKDATITHILLR